MRVWRSVSEDFIAGLEVGSRVVDPRPALGASDKRSLWDSGGVLCEVEGAESVITAVDGGYVLLPERIVYECLSVSPPKLKVVHQ